METRQICLDAARNVTLTAYLQPVGGPFAHVKRRPAVLVLPGGGYQYCSRRESDPVALAFLQAGYQAFVLHYSVGQYCTWPQPLADYEQAMTLIRQKADEWGLYPDKIAVAGFSAGGHLAAAAATMSQNRPNAAILGYAAAGEDIHSCSATAPDTTPYVDRNTCPCFVFSTRTDQVVPIQNSLNFLAALAKADVAFESHIYAYGPHGFSTGDSAIQLDGADPLCPRAMTWTRDAVAWLKDVLGDFGPDGLTEPRCRPHVTDDGAKTLSLDCTIGHLLANPQARALLEPMMAKAGAELGVDSDAAAKSSRMVLRGVLGFMRMPAQQMAELDAALREIPNR